MEENVYKQRFQLAIVLCSVVIMAGKFVAFVLTNSIGILTDALESIVNVVAGFITLYSLHKAAKPRDTEHPFGHGKAELISASVEGILILLAGIFIIYEGISRLFEPSMPGKLDTGILVIALAGVANFILGWFSIRTGRKKNSMALVAGGKHLQSDTYSSIGLVAGLVLLYFTQIPWIDSALALIYGAIIGYTGVSILRKTVSGLLDEADIPLIGEMVEVINECRRPDWIDVHNMKVIKYGNYLYVDCDLTLPWYYNISQGHEVTEQLLGAINSRLSEKIMFSVHSDSCDERLCRHCVMLDCSVRCAPCVEQAGLTFDRITENDEQRAQRLAADN